MPLPEFSIENYPYRSDSGDWFYSSSAANCTAAQQMVASATPGYRHYISSILISSPSAQVVTIQDGAGTVMLRTHIVAATPFVRSFPQGMEYMESADGQKLMIASDTSASIYWTITGFKKPYTV